jgi:hypothetical protein
VENIAFQGQNGVENLAFQGQNGVENIAFQEKMLWKTHVWGSGWTVEKMCWNLSV